jgi:protein SCO1/2
MKKSRSTAPLLPVVLLVTVGLLIGAIAAVALVPGVLGRLTGGGGGGSIGQALIGGPFKLTTSDGKQVTDADYRGKDMLVFFGFTHCPDVCPTTLQLIAGVLDKLGPKAGKVVPLFVTIDPERDGPKQLKDYTSSFHPSIVGLTGTSDEIAATAKAYRVYARKVADDQAPDGYTMDHTAIIYLMGPDGKFVTHFTTATSVDAMAAAIAKTL